MLKKLCVFLIAGVMMVSLAACSSNNDEQSGQEKEAVVEQEEKKEEKSAENQDSTKSLVVYFSYSGNTEKVAQLIAQGTSSDIFEIVPEKAYPEDYDECVDLASEEKAANARPAIKNDVENIDQYDTIYVGYPCWWGTSPMVIFTFLESHDFSGKTIIPFTTHGGSGFGSSISDISNVVKGATVNEDGLSIQDTNVDNCEGIVSDWLESLK